MDAMTKLYKISRLFKEPGSGIWVSLDAQKIGMTSPLFSRLLFWDLVGAVVKARYLHKYCPKYYSFL